MTELPTVAVFGGTGFLGRHVVRILASGRTHVRVVSRHPEQGKRVFGGGAGLEFVRGDINEDQSIRAAASGMFGVVNAVSLYIEHGTQTFHSVHVADAARVAKHSHEVGVARFVHVSGVGADIRSHSPYIRSRGEGEEAVRTAFPGANIVRPTVMFGIGDGFLTPLVRLLRTFPTLPLFGYGQTALQPVHVEDVSEAIVRVFRDSAAGATYEFGGPQVYRYRELLQRIADHLQLRRTFVPMPFGVWHMLAGFAEFLPRPVVTRNQVDLMAIDNVVSPGVPGFSELGIHPRSLDSLLPVIATSA